MWSRVEKASDPRHAAQEAAEPRGVWRSPEVAGLRPDLQGELGEPLGHDGDCATGILDLTADQQRLLPLLLIVEDARIDAFQLPGMKEGRPVDKLAQRGERKVVEHTHAGELRRWNIFGAPFDRRTAGRGRFYR